MIPEELKAKSEALAHIPLSEMEQDLMITEQEIIDLEDIAKHLESTPRSSSDFRMNTFRAVNKRHDIEARKAFCLNLQELIAYRKAMNQQ